MNVLNIARGQTLTYSNSRPSCLLPLGESPQAHRWVKLLELPHPWSYDEALLLCQHSDDEWAAWIPDYGEALLHVTQFC